MCLVAQSVLTWGSMDPHCVRVTPNGRAIRAIREAQRSSLRDLAKKAGINASYLGQIERGKRTPRPQIVHDIAAALAVPEDAICCPHEEGTDP